MVRFLHTTLLTVSLMFTGSVALASSVQRDLAAEEANRALVISFYEQFFNQHQVEQAAKVVVDDYKQHNPEVPDGKAPFVSYFSDFFKQNPQSKARIVRSAAQDDLVYLHVHSTIDRNDRGQAVLDIFRVRNNKIVEHWDVIQEVPEKSANDNGMF